MRPLKKAPPGPLPVLYQDDALIVVNKPSGLSAHRGWSDEGGDYVLTRVRDAVGHHVYLPHRLDRATSGVIVLVRHSELVEPVQRAFQEGRVDKRYLALARGSMPEHTVVDYAVPRGEDNKEDRVEARTEFRLLGIYAERYSLVEAQPTTGRLHQIRRHLKHIFRPIIGDTTYGDGKENKLFRERFALHRLALHASSLVLPHPISGEMLRIDAPIPADLANPLREMGLLS